MNLSRLQLVIAVGVALGLPAGCESFSTRVHLKDGNKFYNGQKYEEAIAEYQKILAADPGNWDANYLTAASYLALYHPGSTHPKDVEYADKAIAALEKCLALKPPDNEALEKIRNFYLGVLSSTNRTDKATAFLEQLLERDPQNTGLMTQLATLYGKAGNFAQALKYYDMRASHDPKDKEAWYTIGVVCWDRSYNGKQILSVEERQAVIERGIAALEKALELDPQYFDALSYINLIYREKSEMLVLLGKYEEAREAYSTAEDFKKKATEVRETQAGAPKQGG